MEQVVEQRRMEILRESKFKHGLNKVSRKLTKMARTTGRGCKKAALAPRDFIVGIKAGKQLAKAIEVETDVSGQRKMLFALAAELRKHAKKLEASARRL